jgi:hypothetical protein
MPLIQYHPISLAIQISLIQGALCDLVDFYYLDRVCRQRSTSGRAPPFEVSGRLTKNRSSRPISRSPDAREFAHFCGHVSITGSKELPVSDNENSCLTKALVDVERNHLLLRLSLSRRLGSSKDDDHRRAKSLAALSVVFIAVKFCEEIASQPESRNQICSKLY